MKWEKCEEQKGGDQHLWSRGCLQKIDHTLHDIGLLLYPLMSQRSPFPENRLEKRKHALKFSYNEDPKTNSRIELGSGLKLKASFSIRYIR